MAKGLSVWLLPEGAAAVRLRETIARLAARLGTEPFEPHVTLLSGLPAPEPPAREACEQFATGTAPLHARVAGVGHGDDFFRCVFLELERDPELVEAHSRARRLFGEEGRGGPFLPHVSLVYGSLDAAARRAILAGLDLGLFSLSLSRVELVRTEGLPGRWVAAASLPLAASSS